MAGGGGHSRELDQTPTWAVALVCAVIVVISIILEKVLHHFGKTFERKKKKALKEALEKIKAELMVLGFISLLLSFGQNYIVKICIPIKVADTMLPCPNHDKSSDAEHHRRLLWYEHRLLAADSGGEGCKHGHVPIISLHGLHQLHIFIFFLAIFHVLYGASTMALGRLKIRGWKEWEKVGAKEAANANDPSKFRLTHETSFVRDHTSFWTKTPILFYIVCFYRQFFRSVRKADYLTMRHGFIAVHLGAGSKFDFQKYIKRSLEDDFKVVVGISPLLWTSAMLYLLLNVSGWNGLFWLSLLPLITTLAVGMKLQAIITRMAVEITEKHAVVQGIPLVQVSDDHFWFHRPKFVLKLIHLTLFQNAFLITHFFWISYEFGLHSCFHANFFLVVVRVCLGVFVQILCSYITLPLYALVTQMGSTMKRSIFDEQTSKALRIWHQTAKNKKKPGQTVQTRTLGGSPPSSPDQTTTHRRANNRNAAESRIEILDSNTPSSGQTANIVASVDMPPENSPGNRDLLTGP